MANLSNLCIHMDYLFQPRKWNKFSTISVINSKTRWFSISDSLNLIWSFAQEEIGARGPVFVFNEFTQESFRCLWQMQTRLRSYDKHKSENYL